MSLVKVNVVVHDRDDRSMLVSNSGRKEDAVRVAVEDALFEPYQAEIGHMGVRAKRRVTTASQGTLELCSMLALRAGLVGRPTSLCA